MEKINRGRLTISANIVLTASLITRTFTFGFIMMLILIKVNNDILDEDVIKIVDMQILAGMPLGTTVKSIVFSFIGVFFLELVTGIFGIWGVIGRKKRVLAVLKTYLEAFKMKITNKIDVLSFKRLEVLVI
ncbi:uncharacterized protein LOC143084306 [Mytilus galloprovincialis]|uniref:uncharacterized protein LOC143084306 n=1 Tax=Mytilus galloprovincialis TaxID=29158 RepID=UPI003F7B839A